VFAWLMVVLAVFVGKSWSASHEPVAVLVPVSI
jgi:hypothetical protein